jgi:glucose-1-phosphate cytidylyltransferase
MGPEETPVLILCGGRGTRLQHQGASIPKALVEIGGMPIVWHVAQCYLAAGFRDIWLLTGYLGDQIEQFVASAQWPGGARVECIDTGIDTPTGGRVAAVADRLGEGQFCLTYGDGVSDIDLAALLSEHQQSGSPVTVTAVQPELPFGVLDLDEGLITGFHEKPRADQWINGGFLCAGPELLSELDRDSVLEREPLEALATTGQLRAHRHNGFWACMDTYKDTLMLNDLYDRNEAPWRRW